MAITERQWPRCGVPHPLDLRDSAHKRPDLGMPLNLKEWGGGRGPYAMQVPVFITLVLLAWDIADSSNGKSMDGLSVFRGRPPSPLLFASLFLIEPAAFVAACRGIAPLGPQRGRPTAIQLWWRAFLIQTHPDQQTPASGKCVRALAVLNVWQAGRSLLDCFHNIAVAHAHCVFVLTLAPLGTKPVSRNSLQIHHK